MANKLVFAHPQKNCPKCAGNMEIGFIADYKHGGIGTSDWVAGEAEKSIWTGIKVRKKKQYLVNTFRCINCGFLESYATEEK